MAGKRIPPEDFEKMIEKLDNECLAGGMEQLASRWRLTWDGDCTPETLMEAAGRLRAMSWMSL